MRNTIMTMILVFFVSPSYGARATIENATVVTIMTDSILFGGCMAKLSPSPHQTLPDCKPDWVALDCSGEFMAKDAANRGYSAAQLALVTEKPVSVRINDLKMHSGYCLAERIDNQ